MRNDRSTGMKRAAWAVLLSIAIGGAVLGLLRARAPSERVAPGVLGAQNPLEIAGPEDFDRLLWGLRSYRYRAEPRGTSFARETYFDTRDWRLAQMGYSYRFTRRVGLRGRLRYRVGIIEFREGSPRSEVSSVVDDALGERAAGGAWEPLLSPGPDLPAARRLHEVLGVLDVNPSEMGPRGTAKATVEEFDLRDKGRTWFEMGYETWEFSELPGPVGRAPVFRWYGIRIRPGSASGEPEFGKRAGELERVLPTFYRFLPESQPRLLRAIAALGG